MRFHKGYTDLKLIAAFRKGDKKAGEEIINRYYPKILSICTHFLRSHNDGQDAAQEVFYKVIAEKKILKFRAQSKLLTWLTRISFNACKSYLRKKGRSLEMTCFEAEGITYLENTTPCREPNPEEAFYKSETRNAIAQAIDKLPPKCRKAIYCIYIKENSYREAARELQIPVNILGVRLMYGRKMLLRLFEKQARREQYAPALSQSFSYATN